VAGAEDGPDDAPETRGDRAQELSGRGAVARSGGTSERHHRRHAPGSRFDVMLGHY
jgi:hypothetical protein